MCRPAIVVAAIALMFFVIAAAGRAASWPDLSGTWTLNRELSDFPRETGFDPDWINGGSGNAGLVNEVKNPPARLTIVQSGAAVTMSDANGWVRTLHAGAKEETIQLKAGPIGATTKWEGPQLAVRYLVEKDRELRYRYSRTDTGQLTVEVQFAEHGHGDVVRRFYDAAN